MNRSKITNVVLLIIVVILTIWLLIAENVIYVNIDMGLGDKFSLPKIIQKQ